MRIMVYGDSNTFGWTSNEKGVVTRFPIPLTWPAVLGRTVGPETEVVIEGLGGRTTDVDRPFGTAGAGWIEGVSMNGVDYLPAALASHMPLDLVVIMLGTNDMLANLNRSAADIAIGMAKLAKIVLEARWQRKTPYPAPRVLMVSPPKVNLTVEPERTDYAGSKEKSEVLAVLARPMVEALGGDFFDAASVVPYAEGPDQMHLTLDNHQALGEALGRHIRTLFGLNPV